MMEYRTLGNSTLNISRVSMGCMSLVGNDVGHERLIHAALEGGINFFDTADLYEKGLNEELVGKALRGRRADVVLATKVGNQWRADGSGWDWNASREYILKAAEASLRRLGTDYIDLYQLHGGTIDDPIDETIEAFETLQRQGKIRYYGISSIRPNVIREYVQRSKISSVMVQYSLLDRRPEEQILHLLSQHSIGVLVRGSLAGGLLVDKPAKGYLTYSAAEVSQVSGAIRAVGGTEHTATATALGYVLHAAVTSAVVGIRTTAQLSAALSGANGSTLTDAEVATLRQTLTANHYTDHR